MSKNIPPSDYAKQQTLIAALRDSQHFPHAAQLVHVVETHISWVLLAGRYAYKIKKSVDFGFLDFTSLDDRKFYCEEEIRLNKRLAKKIYLDVVAIGGTPDKPLIGAQPAIEYAVRMRRFATAKELDHLLAHGLLLPQYMQQLAETLANFHSALPVVKADSIFGEAATIRAAAMQNFETLLSLLAARPECEFVSELSLTSAKACAAGEKYFARRRAQGFVRECHGDLHLGNIVLIGERVIPFDGIEFNPALRWIDVMSEVAFLVMDLLHGQRPDLAFEFLNDYLEATGDYAGVSVLRFYLAYRAAVRAKISAIRAFQPDINQEVQTHVLKDCRDYLTLASECLSEYRPALIITHGLPGSGKSTFAKAALVRLQGIRIRSDVERKRLYGISPLADSKSETGSGIYSADATRCTYTQLLELARELLEAGFPVIVDAAFLRQVEREQFYALAQRMTVPFAIVALSASTATLSTRILRRREAGMDASEANINVLHKLQTTHQPLQP
ncbi:MAG: AAA family ATPase, partial [Gallionellaceae bacterium]